MSFPGDVVELAPLLLWNAGVTSVRSYAGANLFLF